MNFKGYLLKLGTREQGRAGETSLGWAALAEKSEKRGPWAQVQEVCLGRTAAALAASLAESLALSEVQACGGVRGEARVCSWEGKLVQDLRSEGF